jgi:hypothetical protein
MTRFGHHYTAVSGGEFHWLKHILPIKMQLCWTKVSVTAVAHQLFP